MAITAAFSLPIFSLFLSMLPIVPTANAQSTLEEPVVWTQEHVAGVWQGGYLNGPAKGSMINVLAAAIDAAGNIYMIGSGRITVMDASTKRVWNLAGTGVRGYKDGPAQSAMFNPGGAGYDMENIAVNSHGDLFVSDGMNNVIRRIFKNPNHSYQWWVETYSGAGKQTMHPGQTISAANSWMYDPIAITVDKDDNVWTQDYYGFYKITPPYANPPSMITCYQNTTGANAIILATDNSGYVYMCDRIRFFRIDPSTGQQTWIAGVLPPWYSYLTANVESSDSSFAVANTWNMPSTGILQIDSEKLSYTSKNATSFLGCTRGVNGTVATGHSSGAKVNYILIDGPALQSTFFALSSMGVSADGSIYGGNGDENCLRRVKYSSTYLENRTMTLHGSGLQSHGWYTATMRNSDWFLGGPLAVDANGAVYLMSNNPGSLLQLRRIVPPSPSSGSRQGNK